VTAEAYAAFLERRRLVSRNPVLAVDRRVKGEMARLAGPRRPASAPGARGGGGAAAAAAAGLDGETSSGSLGIPPERGDPRAAAAAAAGDPDLAPAFLMHEAQVQRTSGFQARRMRSLPVMLHRGPARDPDADPGNETAGGDQFFRRARGDGARVRAARARAHAHEEAAALCLLPGNAAAASRPPPPVGRKLQPRC
jgi:hypothetical protein